MPSVYQTESKLLYRNTRKLSTRMDIVGELTRLFGVKAAAEMTLGDEVFDHGGYLSFRRQATIARQGGRGPADLLHAFVKWSDVSRTELNQRRDVSNHFCRTECVFYGLMGPVLERVMRQYELEPVFPHAFGQRITDKGTVLVMEDLTKMGFNLVDRRSLSLEQVYCVTRAMARVQAAFWIARCNFNYSLDAVLFGPATTFANGLQSSGADLRPMIRLNAAYFAANAAKRAGDKADAEILLGPGLDRFVANLLRDPAVVVPNCRDLPLGLTHGDLWFSNFMLKRDACRIFDWQFWSVGPFGLDLGLLMLSGLCREDMQSQVNEITAEFYHTFKAIFEAKTGRPAPFSEAEALSNMRHAYNWALFWVVTSSSVLWQTDMLDLPSLLANTAYVVRERLADLTSD